jgi:hypothetical protein
MANQEADEARAVAEKLRQARAHYGDALDLNAGKQWDGIVSSLEAAAAKYEAGERPEAQGLVGVAESELRVHFGKIAGWNNDELRLAALENAGRLDRNLLGG